MLNTFPLDTFTLMVCSAVLAGTVCAFALIEASYDATPYNSALWWTLAMGGLSASFAMWTNNPYPVDLMRYVFGNMVFLGVCLCIRRAVAGLVERSLCKESLAAMCLPGLMGIGAVYLLQAPRLWGVVGMGCSSLLLLGLAARDLWLDAAASRMRGALVLMTLLILVCLSFLVRIAFVLAGGHVADVLPGSSSAIQIGITVLADVFVVAGSLGFMAVRLEKQRKLAEEAAKLDGLTGLCNRAALLAQGKALADQLAELAVLMVDLDRFKQINDTHGHLAGDAVLRHAAKELQRATRSVDVVGRLGGEEFCVVLPGVDKDEAMTIAQRICDRMATHAARTQANYAISYSCSVGVALKVSHEGFEDVIHRADMALYEAKRQGRARVELAPAIGATQPPGSTSLLPQPQA